MPVARLERIFALSQTRLTINRLQFSARFNQSQRQVAKRRRMNQPALLESTVKNNLFCTSKQDCPRMHSCLTCLHFAYNFKAIGFAIVRKIPVNTSIYADWCICISQLEHFFKDKTRFLARFRVSPHLSPRRGYPISLDTPTVSDKLYCPPMYPPPV